MEQCGKHAGNAAFFAGKTADIQVECHRAGRRLYGHAEFTADAGAAGVCPANLEAVGASAGFAVKFVFDGDAAIELAAIVLFDGIARTEPQDIGFHRVKVIVAAGVKGHTAPMVVEVAGVYVQRPGWRQSDFLTHADMGAPIGGVRFIAVGITCRVTQYVIGIVINPAGPQTPLYVKAVSFLPFA